MAVDNIVRMIRDEQTAFECEYGQLPNVLYLGQREYCKLMSTHGIYVSLNQWRYDGMRMLRVREETYLAVGRNPDAS